MLFWLNAQLTFADNVGWKSFFTENSDEFHDIPLRWEKKSAIPSWVTGTFVRNGAAQIKFNSPRRMFSSWLDGFGKLHSFKFNGSRVLFSGKMLETPLYKASVKKGELVPQMTLNKFANPADEWSWFELAQIAYKMTQGMAGAYDNANPAVWRMGPADAKKGIYLAVTDDPVATRFDIDTLETLGLETPKTLPPTISGCTHYMREPGTDNSINIATKLGFTGPYYEVHRWKPENLYQEPEVLARFKPKKTGYFHSFSITENHVVLFNYPASVDPTKFFSSNFHIFETMKVDPTQDTDIYIINLKTGEVKTRRTPYLYSIHHANAYESENAIVVDLAANKFENLREYTKLTNMLNPPSVWNRTATNDITLYRYHIGLKEDGVRIESFQDKLPEDLFLHHFDFPMINEDYRGKPYCILYGWSTYLYSRNALVKKNFCDNSLSKTLYIENHYSGEMFFIANPAKKSEDDGILIATIFDGEKEKSYLLVLDAKSFSPINKAYLPHNIPMSFHGMYFPEAQLGANKKYLKQKQSRKKARVADIVEKIDPLAVVP